MESIQIGEKLIQPFGRVLVIAEIGVNHDGSVNRALELVEIAARSGADAVKLQLFSADRLMHRSASFAEYQSKAVDEPTPREMLRRYELSEESASAIVAATRAAGLVPIATPFSPEDVDLIETLDLPAIKIASPDLVNWPLLNRAAAAGRPLLISTGAATMIETARTAQWLESWRCSFALLHCVSSYPAPDESANLCWIGELRERFDTIVGFSDHATDITMGAMAVAAGAAIVEKHLTYDRSASGPDHSASCDPDQFAQYVQLIRNAERLRGKPGKRVLAIEQDVRNVSRQSLVLARAVGAGHRLSEGDLTVQRPGTGIPASMAPIMIGRIVGRTFAAGDMLTLDALSDAA